MPSSALASAEISTLSLHDALPISDAASGRSIVPELLTNARPHTRTPGCVTSGTPLQAGASNTCTCDGQWAPRACWSREFHAALSLRSEEHTSELQSLRHLVCRLLLSRAPRSPLFPYTTLFRSRTRRAGAPSCPSCSRTPAPTPARRAA